MKYIEHYFPYIIIFLADAAVLAAFNYLPLYAKSFNINDVEIGIIRTIYAAILLISNYIFGRASDMLGRRRFLISGLFLSAIVFLGYHLVNEFFSFILVSISTAFTVGIFSAAMIAYARDVKKKIGRFTSIGALGITFGLLISAYISQNYGIESIFTVNFFLLLAAGIISLRLKKSGWEPINVPRFPRKVIKENLAIYIAFLLRHTGAMIIWTYWPLYLVSIGANLFYVGFVNSFNTLTQFFVAFLISDRLKSKHMIRLGLVLSFLTFFSFTLARNFLEIIPTQIMLGFSWIFLYVGSLRDIMEKTKERGTATGILNSTMNLASIIGPFLATFIIQVGNYVTTMYVATVFGIASIIIFHVLTLLKGKSKS